MNLLDMPADIVGLIFSPWYIKKLGCTVASMVCKILRGIVRGNTLKKDAACAEAAFHGHTAVLWWLRDNGCKLAQDSLKVAARRGHTDMLRGLFARGAGRLTEHLCAAAAGGGHLDTLQLLRVCGCPWDGSTCHRAAKNNHLEILKYAREHRCPLGSGVILACARNGHLEILKWIHSTGFAISSWVFFEAGSGGHIHIIEWLVAKGFTLHSNAYVGAAFRGQLNTIKWLYEKECPMSRLAFAWAIHGNQYEVLKWLYEVGCPRETGLIVEKRDLLRLTPDIKKWLRGIGYLH